MVEAILIVFVFGFSTDTSCSSLPLISISPSQSRVLTVGMTQTYIPEESELWMKLFV